MIQIKKQEWLKKKKNRNRRYFRELPILKFLYREMYLDIFDVKWKQVKIVLVMGLVIE